MTIRAAARALEWSEAKMWRIETGQTAMRTHDVETMCRIYGAPLDLTGALRGMAEETKAVGWWHAYGAAIPTWFDVYVGLEEAAASISEFQPDLIPGLLQTADYARALLRGSNPDMSDEEIEERVDLRIARQALLTRPVDPPQFIAILSEAMLCRPIGPNPVMARQLRRVVELSNLPNVTVHVIPFRAGHHLGLDSGGFILLRFPLDASGAESEPPVVYIEGLTGALYLDKPAEIKRFAGVFDALVESALDVHASRSFILQAAREFEQ